MNRYTVNIRFRDDVKSVILSTETHYQVFFMVIADGWQSSDPALISLDRKLPVKITENHITSIFFIRHLCQRDEAGCVHYLSGFIKLLDEKNIKIDWIVTAKEFIDPEMSQEEWVNKSSEVIDASGIRYSDIWTPSVAHVTIINWFKLLSLELPDLIDKLLTVIDEDNKYYSLLTYETSVR